MPQGIKKESSYQSCISRELYEKCPKSVFAAIAISFATLMSNDGDGKEIEKAILQEWETLHANGIVPQKPFK